MKLKLKDVTPRENASRGTKRDKKSADSLPKILLLAGRGGSLQRQRVRCGKPNCRCARGELHEGYHYLFLSSPAGLSKFYVRRHDVPAVRAVIEARRSRRRALRSELNEARAFLQRMMSAAVGVKI
jgi:hypothetical protein